MTPDSSDHDFAPERKRLFLSRALLLGAIAGSLSTVLVLGTGIMPPMEIGLNFLILVAVFGGAGVAWPVVRRFLPRGRFWSDLYLVAFSILPFALRGCLVDCGAFLPWRIALPASVLLLSALLLAVLQRLWPERPAQGVIIVATIAMLVTALDFAGRDGLDLQAPLQVEIWAIATLLALTSAFLARKGWPVKVLWTLTLGVVSVSWALYSVRPLSIHPSPGKSGMSASEAGTHPNVVLVVMDTVRADHLSLYGYRRKTSPNLEAIAGESLVFDRAIASGNYSLPSHASLFTGLLPSLHGAHQRASDPSTDPKQDEYGLAPGVMTMAERLRDAGYTTGGLSGNYVYLTGWTGLQRGFGAFDQRPFRQVGYHPFVFPIRRRLSRFRYQELIEWDGVSITTAGLAFAAEAKGPFFLFLNYFDAHGPNFTRPGHVFRGDGLGSDENRIPAYDSEIAYTDATIGGLISDLRAQGLLENTILIVAADHGEFFGEHRLWNHQVGAYEPVLHVPLLIRYPQGLKPGRVSRPFGLHEVHRLVFDLLEGRPVDWAYSDSDEPKVLAQVWGIASATDPAGPLSLNPSANIVYSGHYKLIDRAAGDDELYDLAADPAETHNLSSDASLADLLARMQAAVANLPPAQPGADRNATTADLEALRGLGYITLKKPAGK